MMMTLHVWVGAFVIGCLVGFVSGLLGKGGSAVTTPALRLALKVPSYLALASPLPSAIPTTLAAVWAYRKQHWIHYRAVYITCVWGIPATIFGSWASEWVGGHALMLLTALFVIALGFMLLFHQVDDQDERGISEAASLSARKLTVIALGVGLLSGLLANTGGILYAPLFIEWVDMPVKQAMASSLLISAVLAVPGTLAHWYLGHIDWWLVLALSLGTIPCSYLGAKLAIRMRSDLLVKVYGIMLTLFGCYDLFVEVSRGRFF